MSTTKLNNDYFTEGSTSLFAGHPPSGRANYYMKDVPWDTMITVFYWGRLRFGNAGGQRHFQPAEFVDMVNANTVVPPVAGGDKSMCSFMSVECNLDGSGY